MFEEVLTDCKETFPEQLSVTIDERELNTLNDSLYEKEAADESNVPVAEEEESRSSPDNKIKMPPKMIKRGRPRGAETTAIGLPVTKRRKSNKLLPFEKLSSEDKNRFILLALVHDQQKVVQALQGDVLLTEENVKPFNILPDSLRDKCIDIFARGKVFHQKRMAQSCCIPETEN